jgi:chromosome segregation ATPase
MLRSATAFKFDENSWVVLPDAAELQLTAGAFTIEAWVLLEESLGPGGAIAGEALKIVRRNGAFVPGMGDSIAEHRHLRPCEWIHLACAWQGEGTNGQARLFVDGVEVLCRPGPSPLASGSQLCVGQGNLTVSEVRIWDRVLETNALRAVATAPPVSASEGLVGSWRFGQPAEARESGPSSLVGLFDGASPELPPEPYDLSGHRRHGKLRGRVQQDLGPAEVPVMLAPLGGFKALGNSLAVATTQDVLDLTAHLGEDESAFAFLLQLAEEQPLLLYSPKLVVGPDSIQLSGGTWLPSLGLAVISAELKAADGDRVALTRFDCRPREAFLVIPGMPKLRLQIEALQYGGFTPQGAAPARMKGALLLEKTDGFKLPVELAIPGLGQGWTLPLVQNGNISEELHRALDIIGGADVLSALGEVLKKSKIVQLNHLDISFSVFELGLTAFNLKLSFEQADALCWEVIEGALALKISSLHLRCQYPTQAARRHLGGTLDGKVRIGSIDVSFQLSNDNEKRKWLLTLKEEPLELPGPDALLHLAGAKDLANSLPPWITRFGASGQLRGLALGFDPTVGKVSSLDGSISWTDIPLPDLSKDARIDQIKLTASLDNLDGPTEKRQRNFALHGAATIAGAHFAVSANTKAEGWTLEFKLDGSVSLTAMLEALFGAVHESASAVFQQLPDLSLVNTRLTWTPSTKAFSLYSGARVADGTEFDIGLGKARIDQLELSASREPGGQAGGNGQSSYELRATLGKLEVTGLGGLEDLKLRISHRGGATPEAGKGEALEIEVSGGLRISGETVELSGRRDNSGWSFTGKTSAESTLTLQSLLGSEPPVELPPVRLNGVSVVLGGSKQVLRRGPDSDPDFLFEADGAAYQVSAKLNASIELPTDQIKLGQLPSTTLTLERFTLHKEGSAVSMVLEGQLGAIKAFLYVDKDKQWTVLLQPDPSRASDYAMLKPVKDWVRDLTITHSKTRRDERWLRKHPPRTLRGLHLQGVAEGFGAAGTLVLSKTPLQRLLEEMNLRSLTLPDIPFQQDLPVTQPLLKGEQEVLGIKLKKLNVELTVSSPPKFAVATLCDIPLEIGEYKETLRFGGAVAVVPGDLELKLEFAGAVDARGEVKTELDRDGKRIVAWHPFSLEGLILGKLQLVWSGSSRAFNGFVQAGRAVMDVQIAQEMTGKKPRFGLRFDGRALTIQNLLDGFLGTRAPQLPSWLGQSGFDTVKLAYASETFSYTWPDHTTTTFRKGLRGLADGSLFGVRFSGMVDLEARKFAASLQPVSLGKGIFVLTRNGDGQKPALLAQEAQQNQGSVYKEYAGAYVDADFGATPPRFDLDVKATLLKVLHFEGKAHLGAQGLECRFSTSLKADLKAVAIRYTCDLRALLPIAAESSSSGEKVLCSVGGAMTLEVELFKLSTSVKLGVDLKLTESGLSGEFTASFSIFGRRLSFQVDALVSHDSTTAICEAVWQKAKALAGRVWEFFKDIGAACKKLAEDVAKACEKAAQAVWDAAKKLGQLAAEAAKAVEEFLEDVVSAVTSLFKSEATRRREREEAWSRKRAAQQRYQRELEERRRQEELRDQWEEEVLRNLADAAAYDETMRASVQQRIDSYAEFSTQAHNPFVQVKDWRNKEPRGEYQRRWNVALENARQCKAERDRYEAELETAKSVLGSLRKKHRAAQKKALDAQDKLDKAEGKLRDAENQADTTKKELADLERKYELARKAFQAAEHAVAAAEEKNKETSQKLDSLQRDVETLKPLYATATKQHEDALSESKVLREAHFSAQQEADRRERELEQAEAAIQEAEQELQAAWQRLDERAIGKWIAARNRYGARDFTEWNNAHKDWSEARARAQAADDALSSERSALGDQAAQSARPANLELVRQARDARAVLLERTTDLIARERGYEIEHARSLYSPGNRFKVYGRLGEIAVVTQGNNAAREYPALESAASEASQRLERARTQLDSAKRELRESEQRLNDACEDESQGSRRRTLLTDLFTAMVEHDEVAAHVLQKRKELDSALEQHAQAYNRWEKADVRHDERGRSLWSRRMDEAEQLRKQAKAALEVAEEVAKVPERKWNEQRAAVQAYTQEIKSLRAEVQKKRRTVLNALDAYTAANEEALRARELAGKKKLETWGYLTEDQLDAILLPAEEEEKRHKAAWAALEKLHSADKAQDHDAALDPDLLPLAIRWVDVLASKDATEGYKKAVTFTKALHPQREAWLKRGSTAHENRTRALINQWRSELVEMLYQDGPDFTALGRRLVEARKLLDEAQELKLEQSIEVQELSKLKTAQEDLRGKLTEEQHNLERLKRENDKARSRIQQALNFKTRFRDRELDMSTGLEKEAKDARYASVCCKKELKKFDSKERRKELRMARSLPVLRKLVASAHAWAQSAKRQEVLLRDIEALLDQATNRANEASSCAEAVSQSLEKATKEISSAQENVASLETQAKKLDRDARALTARNEDLGRKVLRLRKQLYSLRQRCAWDAERCEDAYQHLKALSERSTKARTRLEPVAMEQVAKFEPQAGEKLHELLMHVQSRRVVIAEEIRLETQRLRAELAVRDPIYRGELESLRREAEGHRTGPWHRPEPVERPPLQLDWNVDAPTATSVRALASSGGYSTDDLSRGLTLEFDVALLQLPYKEDLVLLNREGLLRVAFTPEGRLSASVAGARVSARFPSSQEDRHVAIRWQAGGSLALFVDDALVDLAPAGETPLAVKTAGELLAGSGLRMTRHEISEEYVVQAMRLFSEPRPASAILRDIHQPFHGHELALALVRFGAYEGKQRKELKKRWEAGIPCPEDGILLCSTQRVELVRAGEHARHLRFRPDRIIVGAKAGVTLFAKPDFGGIHRELTSDLKLEGKKLELGEEEIGSLKVWRADARPFTGRWLFSLPDGHFLSIDPSRPELLVAAKAPTEFSLFHLRTGGSPLDDVRDADVHSSWSDGCLHLDGELPRLLDEPEHPEHAKDEAARVLSQDASRWSQPSGMLSFGATRSAVVIDALGSSAGMTFAGCFRLKQAPSTTTLLGSIGQGSGSLALSVKTDQSVSFGEAVSSAAVVPIDRPFRLVATVREGRVALFLDGHLVASGSGPSTALLAPLRVGEADGGFEFEASELGLWSAALEEVELMELSSGRTAPGRYLHGLVGHWRVAEARDRVVRDASGHDAELLLSRKPEARPAEPAASEVSHGLKLVRAADGFFLSTADKERWLGYDQGRLFVTSDQTRRCLLRTAARFVNHESELGAEAKAPQVRFGREGLWGRAWLLDSEIDERLLRQVYPDDAVQADSDEWREALRRASTRVDGPVTLEWMTAATRRVVALWRMMLPLLDDARGGWQVRAAKNGQAFPEAALLRRLSAANEAAELTASVLADTPRVVTLAADPLVARSWTFRTWLHWQGGAGAQGSQLFALAGTGSAALRVDGDGTLTLEVRDSANEAAFIWRGGTLPKGLWVHLEVQARKGMPLRVVLDGVPLLANEPATRARVYSPLVEGPHATASLTLGGMGEARLEARVRGTELVLEPMDGGPMARSVWPSASGTAGEQERLDIPATHSVELLGGGEVLVLDEPEATSGLTRPQKRFWREECNLFQLELDVKPGASSEARQCLVKRDGAFVIELVREQPLDSFVVEVTLYTCGGVIRLSGGRLPEGVWSRMTMRFSVADVATAPGAREETQFSNTATLWINGRLVTFQEAREPLRKGSGSLLIGADMAGLRPRAFTGRLRRMLVGHPVEPGHFLELPCDEGYGRLYDRSGLRIDCIGVGTVWRTERDLAPFARTVPFYDYEEARKARAG